MYGDKTYGVYLMAAARRGRGTLSSADGQSTSSSFADDDSKLRGVPKIQTRGAFPRRADDTHARASDGPTNARLRTMSAHDQQSSGQKITEVLPKAGLVYSEKGNLTEVLCKPKIMPLKSVTLERIEEMERQAAQLSETMAAQERERTAKEGEFPPP